MQRLWAQIGGFSIFEPIRNQDISKSSGNYKEFSQKRNVSKTLILNHWKLEKLKIQQIDKNCYF